MNTMTPETLTRLGVRRAPSDAARAELAAFEEHLNHYAGARLAEVTQRRAAQRLAKGSIPALRAARAAETSKELADTLQTYLRFCLANGATLDDGEHIPAEVLRAIPLPAGLCTCADCAL